MGDWRAAPSGINCEKKMQLLRGEGVMFDARGYLVGGEGKWWGGFKAGSGQSLRQSQMTDV
jgi:methylated-DNA-[protein]-cysteine S-methyltransferase